MRTAVVINPTSVADVERVRADVGAALAAAGCPEPLWSQTSADDPGRGQTRAAVAAGAQVVFACGGDGTIRACADQLAGTPVALAVLPAGTGNLFVANLGLPTDVKSCIDTVVTGQRRLIDLGCSEGQHFTLMTGMGFDAAMMEATPASWKRRLGWPAYILGGLRRVFDRPMRVRIALDGQPPIPLGPCWSRTWAGFRAASTCSAMPSRTTVCWMSRSSRRADRATGWRWRRRS
jgi:diacylglycerol kinase family enzyme